MASERTLRAGIFDETGVYLGSADLEPICGEHFCDRCGDCIDCYWCDPCRDGGSHRWVIYADELEQAERHARTKESPDAE